MPAKIGRPAVLTVSEGASGSEPVMAQNTVSAHMVAAGPLSTPLPLFLCPMRYFHSYRYKLNSHCVGGAVYIWSFSPLPSVLLRPQNVAVRSHFLTDPRIL
jgi:hypothetical protein